jgi:CRISPR-associated Csx2 family protein
MTKLFISFLGTSRYLECCYQFGDEISAPVRFVQEHTIKQICDQWEHDDRIVIFTTVEAKKKNWHDNGHGDTKQGLATRLAELGLKASVNMVEIPAGHNEEQIWEIFSLVLEQIHRNNEVVFDITHAFRSIPLLAMVILNYAKVVRKARLIGIYYGAFEVLGAPHEVEKSLPDPYDRVAPIMDLTPLDRLLDWSFAVDKLLKAGDATAIRALTRASVAPLLKESKGNHQAAKAFQRLGDELQQFTLNLTTCRVKEIGANAIRLQGLLAECGQTSLTNPLKPLIAEIEKEIAPFDQDPVRDGIHAAKWCLTHHLIQQGLTILNETLITWCLVTAGEGQRLDDSKARSIASQAMDIVKRKRPEHEWIGNAQNDLTFTRRLIRSIQEWPGVEDVAYVVREYRNDINHGGTDKYSKDAASFREKLSESLKKMETKLIV